MRSQSHSDLRISLNYRKCIVKQRYSKVLALCIIAASLLAGMIVATSLKTKSLTQVTPVNETHSSPDGQYQATQFVQDPPQRATFRPDFSQGLRRSNQRSNFFMLRAFHDAVGDSWKSTVRLTKDSQQVALGAIVGSDGWIITKASELPASGEIVCRLYDGSSLDAVEVNRNVDLDLALLHVEKSELPVVRWETSGVPDRGRWLATTDVQTGVPSAVGVVSAGVQKVNRSTAVLGVHLDNSSRGALVTLVLPGSGAQEAGLQVGDSILAVNGNTVNSHEAFKSVVKGGQGGEIVNLRVSRSDLEFETSGRLMDLADELLDETEMEVNGNVSARASGFERVFLHDTVLEPNQCGGPLVNLDGRVVGINIARAGRVSSYALPADVVQPIVEELISAAKVVSHASGPRSTLRPIR
jgi:serine protease Do